MNISQVIAKIKAGPNDITLYRAATQIFIRGFEIQMNLRLPNDLKTFYQFCNGFESQEDLFRIIPLDEILSSKTDSQAHLRPNQFYFAEYLTRSDMWAIEVNATVPNSYTVFGSTRNVSEMTLTHSFAEFLDFFLTGGVFGDNGLYQVEEAIKKQQLEDSASL